MISLRMKRGRSGINNIDGDPLDELLEVLHHNEVKELLLAAEVVVEEGQVDAGFLGDVAGAGGGKSFLGKETPGRFLDAFLRGGLFCGGCFF